uniref:Uncharacterized protein n=1 Tax=Cacopsylla melanoneura TaxID=428564 RepID=A0A8D8RJH0_9HEMI
MASGCLWPSRFGRQEALGLQVPFSRLFGPSDVRGPSAVKRLSADVGSSPVKKMFSGGQRPTGRQRPTGCPEPFRRQRPCGRQRPFGLYRTQCRSRKMMSDR